ncbi:chitinase 1 [Fusarium beomiforme]|uniref:chitinase n=1 Tax=Fusarium beomiforme TaxID=44412 RepID=A0A9P5E1X7_9HYPO|nr:chitinase 1 [Fusarium beomiforme]
MPDTANGTFSSVNKDSPTGACEHCLTSGIYARNFQPRDLDVSHISHVLYAFLNLKSDGTVYVKQENAGIALTRTEATLETDTPILRNTLEETKANRHLKTQLSIGGWTWYMNFPDAASTPEGRAKFTSTSVELRWNWGFDGIDVDWEYPFNEIEATNFVLLLQAVRNELDTYGQKYASGHHFLLSIAAPAGLEKYEHLHLKDIGEIVDHINLMAYDYSGSWDKISGHNANLYPYNHHGAKMFDTDKAVNDYITAEVPPDKIVLGMPIYGRSFEGNSGFGESYRDVGGGSWEPGVWDYKALPKPGAVIKYDPAAQAYYSYEESTKELISYDTPPVVRKKVEYLLEHGLGGSMFWEVSADKEGDDSLIITSYNVLGGLDMTENWLDYNNYYYYNIASGM